MVRVRPELVVEIAFDGVQTSPRYPGGVALRFARVLRYREDKTAAEADTIDTVLAIHAGDPRAGLRPGTRGGPGRRAAGPSGKDSPVHAVLRCGGSPRHAGWPHGRRAAR